MASPALDQGTDRYALDARSRAADEPSYGWWNRTVNYAPRFSHHLRRRVKSGMSFGAAWHSARLRMHDYR